MMSDGTRLTEFGLGFTLLACTALAYIVEFCSQRWSWPVGALLVRTRLLLDEWPLE
jgi:uncharacterized integral membrane protein